MSNNRWCYRCQQIDCDVTVFKCKIWKEQNPGYENNTNYQKWLLEETERQLKYGYT